MQILTVDKLYKTYPERNFYKLFYTDKQIENFKIGLNENENGITFTGSLNETINFPFGLTTNFPIGEIWPKYICRVYFTDENDNVKITDYSYTVNKYSVNVYNNDNIDLDNLENYKMMKCNKCIFGKLLKFDPFLYPHKCNDYNGYIKGNGNILQFIEPESRTLKMCKLAVKNNSSAIKYVKEEFKQDIIDYMDRLKEINKIKDRIIYLEDELDASDLEEVEQINEIKKIKDRIEYLEEEPDPEKIKKLDKELGELEKIIHQLVI